MKPITQVAKAGIYLNVDVVDLHRTVSRFFKHNPQFINRYWLRQMHFTIILYLNLLNLINQSYMTQFVFLKYSYSLIHLVRNIDEQLSDVKIAT